jgi:hypothetical protein
VQRKEKERRIPLRGLEHKHEEPERKEKKKMRKSHWDFAGKGNTSQKGGGFTWYNHSSYHNTGTAVRELANERLKSKNVLFKGIRLHHACRW